MSYLEESTAIIDAHTDGRISYGAANEALIRAAERAERFQPWYCTGCRRVHVMDPPICPKRGRGA